MVSLLTANFLRVSIQEKDDHVKYIRGHEKDVTSPRRSRFGATSIYSKPVTCNVREKKLVTRAFGDAACVTRSPRLTQEKNVILLVVKRQIRAIFVLFCNASRRPISNVQLFMY